ncbi:hypothetical protein ARALYDRAFT_893754 [Arabidopsis lyrata subsp. lyrata]|uniref:E3 ubiquitin-protein ligase ORTHRUS n=1 Tax=Arabidopsis lyrata subsp. lyrata TaxID=81972 RepID=D7KYN3_ARALL|nr:hypothetical protein ARALYDRAFT_893754 [Arabidopsis lyrata subsp. lyrata]
MGQRNRSCGTCRSVVRESMASNPRITCPLCLNEDRPEKAFTTERAKKPGNVNASSRRIFVTIPLDHFGPIPTEDDSVRNQCLLVGESWKGRLECWQWRAHFPPVCGIAGHASYGALCALRRL